MGKKKIKKISGAEKTELKLAKKINKKIAKEAIENGEEDIETLLQRNSNLNNVEKVVEAKCAPPSPRCNMTLNAHPEKDILLMFGGEYSNGKQTSVYNDLFIYHIRSNAWTQVMTPNPPPPRCTHQAVTMPQLGGQLWVFGGEFSSPSQSQFHHYHELWCLHLAEYSWQKINAPGGPSARSGHRMVACKKLLVLFGGFYDNSREFKYFNDIHIFNVESFVWLKLNISGIPPSPRSGCVLVTTQDQRNIVMYGGYSKERIKADEDKGTIYTDMYMLSLEKSKNEIDDFSKWRWQNIKQRGDKPTPRCSMSIIVSSSNRAVLFGGVNDEEDLDDKMKSNFFNDMYRLEIDKGVWHLVDFTRNISEVTEKKRRRKNKLETTSDAKATSMMSSDDDDYVGNNDEVDNEDDDNEIDVGKRIKKLKVKEEQQPNETANNFNTLQENEDNNIFKVTFGPVEPKDQQPTVASLSHIFVPSPRMRPMLAAKRGILYLYGGVYEDEKDRVVTLSDFYSIDMQKLDHWNVLIQQDIQKMEWQDSSSSDEESSDDDENSDDDDDDDSDDDEDIDDQESDNEDDPFAVGPARNDGENFQTYFNRTESTWLEKAKAVAIKENIDATERQTSKAASRMAKEFWQNINK